MERKISIIIPVYNSERTLEPCLNSVKKLDSKNYEVILVNDNSRDSSLNIAKKFRFKMINLSKNVGAAEARNIGARAAKGELLLFVDSDIVLPRDTLKKVFSYYKKGHNIFIGRFYSKLRFSNLFSQYKHLYLCYYYSKQGKTLHTLDTSLTVIKKDIFDKYHGFKKDLRISEDAELGTRLTRSGEEITQPQSLNMEHLKYYSLRDFIQTDFIRGKRFSKLLLSSVFKDKQAKNKDRKKSFFLKPINLYISVGITPFLLLSLLIFIFLRSAISFLILSALIFFFILLNIDFWHYLAKQRNLFFALKSAPVTFLDMVVFDIGITATFFKFLIFGKKELE